MFHPLKKAAAAAVVLLGHFVVSLVMVAAIWGLEVVFKMLFAGQEPLIWGVIPLKYLFQTSEVATFSVFTIWGIIEAHKTMKG
jgi:hypothetical protein